MDFINKVLFVLGVMFVMMLFGIDPTAQIEWVLHNAVYPLYDLIAY